MLGGKEEALSKHGLMVEVTGGGGVFTQKLKLAPKKLKKKDEKGLFF